MNRTHLAAFHAVAESGSFIRGAATLGVGQPVISSHVADLELSLNTALFERLPRGVRLTEAGNTLLKYARDIALLESQASQAIADLAGLKTGHLRLGASMTTGSYLLPATIADFSHAHPGVTLSLEIANTDEIQSRLLTGHLNAAVTEGVVENPALSSTIIYRDHLDVVAPPSHPLLQQKRVTIRDIVRYPLIRREPGSGTRTVIERAFARKRITLPESISIGSPEAIKQAVIAGAGIAIISRLAVQTEIKAGLLVPIPVTDLSLERPFHLVTVNGRPPSAATRAFIAILTKI